MQLGFGLYVEALHLGRQRVAHFPGLLAYARKNDLGRVGANRQRALEFSARNDVQARAQPHEFLQYRQIGIGLHAVADQHGALPDGAMVGCPGGLEGRAGIDVQRGA
ncbi:hypothetical protein D3C73_1226800 [compost metagenome]